MWKWNECNGMQTDSNRSQSSISYISFPIQLDQVVSQISQQNAPS